MFIPTSTLALLLATLSCTTASPLNSPNLASSANTATTTTTLPTTHPSPDHSERVLQARRVFKDDPYGVCGFFEKELIYPKCCVMDGEGLLLEGLGSEKMCRRPLIDAEPHTFAAICNQSLPIGKKQLVPLCCSKERKKKEKIEFTCDRPRLTQVVDQNRKIGTPAVIYQPL